LAASLDDYAEALAAGIEQALPGWVVKSVERIMAAWAGNVPDAARRAAVRAGQEAQSQTGAAIRDLLETDIADQRSTPLTLLRQAVCYPTAVLRQAGVPPVERDRFARTAFPDDDYDLSPATWADIDPRLSELGIAWGAAKAFEHKRRHKPAFSPDAGQVPASTRPEAGPKAKDAGGH
jgi:hypothetical protein